MMANVRTGAASDVGRVRQVNEDSLLTGAAIFAVADGMGGYAAGDVASSLAVTRLRDLGTRTEIKPDDIRAELVLANEDIRTSASAHPERAGMGTTVAGLTSTQLAGTEHWVIFNVGDSRVYRFAADTLVQMTVDHSEVQEMVAAGSINAEQARTYPRRHVVTRALGTDPAPEPDVWVLPSTPGERFLICSDGLPLEVADRDIAAVLRAERTPQLAADALVRAAVTAGGRDNVTVVIVDHMGADRTSVDRLGEDAESHQDTVPRAARRGPA